MDFHEENNGIFVPEFMLDEEENCRQYVFFHEVLHSIAYQLNPELSAKNMTMLVQEDSKDIEKGWTYCAFDEGLADYCAIKSIKTINNKKLIKIADLRAIELNSQLEEWTTQPNIHLMAQVYKVDECEWEKMIIKNLRWDNNGAMLLYRYFVGYYFASMLNPENLKETIKNPPTNYEELLFPGIYKKRVTLSST